jgi:hypothetical protein
VKIAGFSAAELDAFRAHQRDAFAVLTATAAELRAGDSERDVARRLRKRFHERGVHHYFHVPVALFGERTAYPGDFGPLAALPTDRRLTPGDPVILDAAPICDGYTVDTSYACAFGANPLQRELLAALQPLRTLILERVRQRASFRAIAREVDAAIRAQGYENCHRKHIAAVLGHRLTRVPDRWLNRRRVWGLAVQQVGWFFAKSFQAERFGGAGSPNWNHARSSDHPPTPGLWAVEPHVGCRGVGAKFEEILVITPETAWWLDDGGLPHQRAWGQAAAVA